MSLALLLPNPTARPSLRKLFPPAQCKYLLESLHIFSLNISSTQTRIATTTKTAQPATTHITVTSTKKATITTTRPQTIDQTLVTTVDKTQSTTAEVTATTETSTIQTATTTETIYETVSLTSTYSTDIVFSTEVITSTVAALQNRAEPSLLAVNREQLHKLSNATLEARHGATKCSPTTKSASTFPAYASTCRRAEAYSSACACLGVKATTTTLSPSTVYSTTTKCITVTPTKTFTVTRTAQTIGTATVRVFPLSDRGLRFFNRCLDSTVIA